MYGYGYRYSSSGSGGTGGVNTLFSDDFNRATLGGDWSLTNLGSGNGVTFDMTGSEARWNCAHTAGAVQPTRENNISTSSTWGEDYMVLIGNVSYTDQTLNLAQFELAFWWDNDNRFYFGNEAASNQMFFRTREAGSVNHSYISAAADLNSSYKIIWDKANELLSFYFWDISESEWVAVATDLDVSGVVTGGADPMISFGCSDKNNRNGGDTGLLDYVYLLDGDITTETP